MSGDRRSVWDWLVLMLGPALVVGGAVVTFPSMLAASWDVQMNVGSGWTLFVVVIGLLLGLLLFTWKPGAHWARRICIGLSVLLMLYGSVMTLWGISVATGRNVPTGDLPYLVGLPIVSGMGGLVSLVVAWRLSSSAAGSA